MPQQASYEFREDASSEIVMIEGGDKGDEGDMHTKEVSNFVNVYLC